MKLTDDLKIKGRVRITVTHADGSRDVGEYENLVVNAGKAAIARALYDPTFAVRVAYVEVGTGITAPAAGDTALETSAYRKALSSGNSSGAVVSLAGYLNLTETSGAFKEAGLFIGGTSTPGSGTLLSRVAIDKTKTTSDTMTVEWEITIS